MAIYYLGPFPPEYGGVTVKNQVLCAALEQHIPVRRLDLSALKRGDIRVLLRLLGALLRPGSRFVIGVAGRGNRKRLTGLLYDTRRRVMGRSLLLMMGGRTEMDSRQLLWTAAFHRVYVETAEMKQALERRGLGNVAVYPNPRPRPETPGGASAAEGPLRCVFFSRIQREKGADLVLRAAELLPEVSFSFYGPVDMADRAAFFAAAANLPNVRYHGVCAGTGETVYRVLRRHHVLLFPTRWTTEGVPGALAEAKLSGLAVIASRESYNPALVSQGRDGLLLEENTAECLAAAIRRLDRDRELLARLQAGSLRSGQKYCLDAFLPEILSALEAEP